MSHQSTTSGSLAVHFRRRLTLTTWWPWALVPSSAEHRLRNRCPTVCFNPSLSGAFARSEKFLADEGCISCLTLHDFCPPNCPGVVVRTPVASSLSRRRVTRGDGRHHGKPGGGTFSFSEQP